MDIPCISSFSLDWSDMKTWGKYLWALLAVVVVLIGSIIYICFEGFRRSHVVYRYLIWIVILVGGIVWNTKRLKGIRALHIHHYVLAFIFLSLIGYQSELLTIVHGFCMGMFIEGGCRWGYDPIWTPIYG